MLAVHGVVRWRLIDLAELNPVENWELMRDYLLSNRVFKSYDRHLRPYVLWRWFHSQPSERGTTALISTV
jgi:hypothetical protein